MQPLRSTLNVKLSWEKSLVKDSSYEHNKIIQISEKCNRKE